VAVGRELTHDPTCPIGLATDELMVSDRDWFDTRPGVLHRCRAVTSGERMEMGLMAQRPISAESVIHVQQLTPGSRARALYVPGDQLVEPGVVAVFGHLDTFDYLASQGKPFPRTQRWGLPGGLEARMFRLPDGIDPANFAREIDGVVLIPPGASLPVPA
jgi:hypothetical protein